jgi:hypothetical protein
MPLGAVECQKGIKKDFAQKMTSLPKKKRISFLKGILHLRQFVTNWTFKALTSSSAL